MTSDIVIDLDAKHKAHRSGSKWLVQKRQADGSWDMVAHWAGGRRSLLQWCESNGVYPTRAAEELLATLPESTGFRERG